MGYHCIHDDIITIVSEFVHNSGDLLAKCFAFWVVTAVVAFYKRESEAKWIQGIRQESRIQEDMSLELSIDNLHFSIYNTLQN